MHKNKKIASWFGSGLVLCLLTGGCATDRSVIASATQANDQLQPAIMNDPQISQYMQMIGDRIIASAKDADARGIGPEAHKKGDNSWMFSNRMKFHLVNSKTINAFTTGGEHMYVYNALLQVCDTEDQLAAVMSHEFAHVYCRHVQQGTDRQYEQLGAAGAVGAAGYAFGDKNDRMGSATTAFKAGSAILQFAGMRYTRGDEAQADEYGIRFYCMSGWDPDHFGDFFQKLIDMGMDTTPEMMSDHPALKNRVATAKEHAAGWKAKYDGQYRKSPIADPAAFVQIKARAAQLAKSTPDDTQLKQAQQLLASFQNCVTPVDQPEQVKARQEIQKKVQEQQRQDQEAQQRSQTK